MKDLILSATTLIGDDVVNYNGENLGEVKEIMLDIVCLLYTSPSPRDISGYRI
ncbi:PRC-barrel domain-containing protein, partial [Francisella tularensis]|uniref:PRC-barrel domain-containing protein n=1 Tax=Francisella tularensis TaxID=263 RepID=UPI001C0EB548